MPTRRAPWSWSFGGDGAPTSVRVDPDWRRVVGAAGLGPAVLAALAAADHARLAAWAEGVNRSPEDGADHLIAAGPTFGRDQLGDPASRQSQAALREVFDLIGQVTGRLSEFGQDVVAASQRPVETSNMSRTVRVAVTDGVVKSVEFDREWLMSSRPERIGDAIHDALSVAARAAVATKAQMADALPEISRLRNLTASPEALLRQVGFLR